MYIACKENMSKFPFICILKLCYMINVFKFKLELVFELERVIVSNEVMKEDQIKVSGLVP